MLPRRSRRKQSGILKTPLVFAESPVHLVHRLLSPVLPCDHPAHADVVPVELSKVWVSPQFRNQPKPSGKSRRTTHQTQPSSRTHSTRTAGDESGYKQQSVKRKYVPLRMFGEDSVAAEVQEDLQIEATSSQSQTCPQAKHKSCTQSETNLNNISMHLNTPPSVCVDKQRTRTRRRRRSTGEDSTSGEFTQLRPKRDRHRKKGAKLGFPSCSSESHDELHPGNNVNEPGTPRRVQDRELACPVTPDPPTTCDLPSPPQPTRVFAKPQSSVQPRGQVLGLSRLFETSHLYEDNFVPAPHQVLAFDTPESEYGKTFRWRQLNPRASTRSNTRHLHKSVLLGRLT